MELRELKQQHAGLIGDLANLHLKAFPAFFLTQLGFSFLKTLYLGYLEDQDSGIIVAE